MSYKKVCDIVATNPISVCIRCPTSLLLAKRHLWALRRPSRLVTPGHRLARSGLHMRADWRPVEYDGSDGRPTRTSFGREGRGGVTPQSRDRNPALEQHYSVYEVSQMWGLSEKTIRRIFSDEPGVVKWGQDESRFKRAYVTLRIPQSVVERVHRRLRQAG